MRKILLVLAVLLAVSSAYAKDFEVVGAEEVKKMIDGKKKIAVVDARTEKEFREGHIPTSINIPPERLAEAGKLLPKGKKTLIVFYCRGVG